MAGALVSIGFGTANIITAKKAAKKAARRARQIASLNVAAFERQAVDILFRGREQVRANYYAAGQLKGAQLARQSAAGINANFGSAAQVRAKTAADAAFNSEIIRESARRSSQEALHNAKLARLGGASSVGQIQGQGIAGVLRGSGQIGEGIGSLIKSGSDFFKDSGGSGSSGDSSGGG